MINSYVQDVDVLNFLLMSNIQRHMYKNFPDAWLLTSLERRGSEHLLARYQKSDAWLSANQEAVAMTLFMYINYLY